MSKTRQPIQARFNGANSKGARSPQAREPSSGNATSHGLYAQSACLASENRELYLQHHQLFRDRYQPVSPFQSYLVTRIADIDWKLLRAGHIESALAGSEVDAQIPVLSETPQDTDPKPLGRCLQIPRPDPGSQCSRPWPKPSFPPVLPLTPRIGTTTSQIPRK